jgi:hypothetical protein
VIGFFRAVFIIGWIIALVVMFTNGFWIGLCTGLAFGVLTWVGLTLGDLFRALRNALRGPRVEIHIDGEADVREHYPDPTIPDDHPVIVIDNLRRRK